MIMTENVVPESRTYRHFACKTETTISGQPFSVMSNPLSDMARTWCSQCGAHFPLSEYEWSDTNEKVTDYYARHSAKATPLQVFLCSRRCMILLAATGFLLGAIGGYFLFRNNALWLQILMPIACGGFGAFGGLAVYISALCGPITQKVCGVSDTRTLT